MDRIGAVFTNGDVWLKEGPTYAVWQQLTSGVNVGNLSMSGQRISLYDQGDTGKAISIKEPNWNSVWNRAYWSDGSTPYATKTLVSQLSDDSYRLLVLRDDGSVVMKDGPWNTGWWSGTLQPSGTVTDIVIGGDRIGVIMSNGDFYAKQLTPGKFSHPNNVPWSLVAIEATQGALTNNRVGYIRGLNGNNLFVKEGGVDASNWVYEFDNAAQIRMAANRICVLKADNSVSCKDGDLYAKSVLTYNNANDIQVSSDRFAVVTPSHDAYVMEGPLIGNTKGWQFIGLGNIQSLKLN